MPQIKGSLGSIVIASESIAPGTNLGKSTRRKGDDPINYVRVECKIPQSMKYNVGNLSVFNFLEELEKVTTTKYTDILQL